MVAENHKLKVNEIFFSLQGESSFAGYPCVFVRLTGCNLRCSYCDTSYAYEEGEEIGISEIIGRISPYGCKLVEITGGEPLLQAGTPAMIKKLLDDGYKVLLETNGSLDISGIDIRCVIIMDIKLPSSGMMNDADLKNLDNLKGTDELKFIIGDSNDYSRALDILRSLPARLRDVVVNLSPAFGILEAWQLAEWILADQLSVRINLQLHKIIWPCSMRGV